MKLLDDAVALEWLREHGLDVPEPDGLSRTLAEQGWAGVSFSTKGSAAQQLLLAYFLVSELNQLDDESAFAGGLLRLSRWDIGSDVTDAPGIYLARSVWAPSTNDAKILPQAQLFEAGDFVAAQACVSLPILFEWDAHYVPASGTFIARISHEGFVEVVSEYADMLQRVRERCTAASVELLSV